jgi:hypothetical protein
MNSGYLTILGLDVFDAKDVSTKDQHVPRPHAYRRRLRAEVDGANTPNQRTKV